MLNNQSILRVLAPFDRDPTTSANYHLHSYHIYKASNDYKKNSIDCIKFIILFNVCTTRLVDIILSVYLTYYYGGYENGRLS